jgi:hypothetical protein
MKKTINKTRGGSRPNAGRKPLGGNAKKTTSVVMTPTLIKKIDKLAYKSGLSRSKLMERLIQNALSRETQ